MEVSNHTKEIFQDIDACIRFWGDNLEDMFENADKNHEEPEIQSLFNTGISSGLDFKGLREKAEEAYFGYPARSWREDQPPTKNEDRPIYGYAASKGKAGRVD